METIPTTAILDLGATFLTNHPDHLAKRIALAQLLVSTRAVKTIEAGILAFKIWAVPDASAMQVATILNLANEKSSR